MTLLDTVDSTNDELRRRAAAGADDGHVVLAERQTAGRGRQGRSWHSPRGLGLYVSLLLRDWGPEALATRWTLAAAVACCEACRAVAGAPATIKWPNDVEVAGRKLAGILADLRGGGALVLGCGINVAHGSDDFPPEVAARATSLALGVPPGPEPVDREALLASYLERFAGLRQALDRGDWDAVRERWMHLAPGAENQAVRVTRGESVFVGRTRGIDSSGGLRVEDAEGRIEVVRLADAVGPAEPERGD